MSYHSTRKVQTVWKPGAQSRTKQSFAKDCNINNIMKKYVKTGQMPVCEDRAIYGDFSNVSDYQTQLNRINSVKTVFAALPPELRARFKHDPANLIAFVGDPANTEEGIKLGLLPKPPSGANYVDKDGKPCNRDGSPIVPKVPETPAK